jgi:hypothetical protein
MSNDTVTYSKICGHCYTFIVGPFAYATRNAYASHFIVQSTAGGAEVHLEYRLAGSFTGLNLSAACTHGLASHHGTSQHSPLQDQN